MVLNVFDRLGRRIAGELDELRARSSERERVRDRLGAIDLDAKPSFRRGSLIAVAIVIVLVLGAGWLALVRHERTHASLTATFGAANQRATVGIWLEAPETGPLPLHFSDGTHIDMAPRSRARLVDLTPAGAHLLVETGEAHVVVVHKPHASWLLSVGPFAIHVTGTRFDVRWDPDLDALELSLDEGRVELSGCMIGEAHRVLAGERARASCKRGYFEIIDRKGSNAAPADLPPNAAEPVQALASAPPEPAAVAPRRGDGHRAAARESSASWRDLAERGKYAEALLAASQGGFESQCALANAGELGLLADIARFAGDFAKASHALQLLRRRFPGSGPAATAAFTLGRMEFDAGGSFAKAADWFRTYLREQPTGPLVREARGRLLEALHRAGDDRAARDVAVEYLHDYPAGPHATLAKNIRSSGD